MLELYRNIKMLREEKGMSQDELAKLCGYTSRSSICVPSPLRIAIAAHFDGDDFTEEEMDDIRAYAEFVKNRRNKK